MRIIFIAALLGACTTIGEMQAAEPRATYESSKSVQEVSACVATQVQGHGPPSVIPGEAETLVTFNPSGSNVVLSVTVRPSASGSHVEVRQAMDYFARPAVERCI
jgi:hypothetical protein